VSSSNQSNQAKLAGRRHHLQLVVFVALSREKCCFGLSENVISPWEKNLIDILAPCPLGRPSADAR
jgi:hypothetical protein